MELLTDDDVPEHARDVKREAREFAAEYVAPNAAQYFESGEYPEEVLRGCKRDPAKPHLQSVVTHGNRPGNLRPSAGYCSSMP
jgi:hypothetical protein